MNMTPNRHTKLEWARMAQAAYRNGRNDIGHRYSGAAALPEGAAMDIARYDALQHDYRNWLIADEYPTPVTA